MARRRGEAPPVPDDLAPEERAKLGAWVQRHARPEIRALYPQLRELVDDCLSHWGALRNPKGYTDWYRAVQNWITRTPRFRRDARDRWRATELPRDDGARLSDEQGGELIELGTLFGGRK